MDKEKLNWIENAAIENMKSRQENIDQITTESHITLTIAFSAIGVVFAYAIQNADTDKSIFFAGLVTTAYLIFAAWYLVSNCLIQGEFPSVHNEPKNLSQEGYTLAELREFELINIQKRIDDACAIIVRRSNSLNNVRKAIAAFPIISLVIWQLLRTC